MPVRKFRSIEEAGPPIAQTRGAEADLRAAFELSELCQRLNPWSPPPGVHRNTSITEAQERRRQWELAARPGS